jgi:hypothetical protein
MAGATDKTLDLLRRFESRNVLFTDPEGGWPIVWTQARGCHVRDAEGRHPGSVASKLLRRHLSTIRAFSSGVGRACRLNVRSPLCVRIQRMVNLGADVRTQSAKRLKHIPCLRQIENT